MKNKLLLVLACTALLMTACGTDDKLSKNTNSETTAGVTATMATAVAESVAANQTVIENPGYFESDNWSISYDPANWYGTMDEEKHLFVTNFNTKAGSSFIELYELDCETVAEAVDQLVADKRKNLTEPVESVVNGMPCYTVFDAETPEGATVYLFDYYLLFEHNGKVIVVDECITHDGNEPNSGELSNEFDVVVNTLVLK